MGIRTAEFSLLSGFDPMFQPAQTPVTARTAGSCGWPGDTRPLSCFSSSQAPYLSFPPQRAKTRSFHCSSSPHRTRLRWASAGSPFGPPQSPRNRPKFAQNSPCGAGASPVPQPGTQPLTAGSTRLLGPAAPGASAPESAPFPAPAPPASAGSADQSLPVEALLCTTNFRFGSHPSWL